MNIEINTEKHKQLYDRNSGTPEFKSGDSVWCYNPPHATRTFRKGWKGPPPGDEKAEQSCMWFNLPLLLTICGSCRPVNTLRPRQNGRHFTDDIFKRIFVNENIWIPITISQKFVPKGSINNIPALVRIMAWRRPGDKPLSEPMMVNLPTHICITWPQWVK